MATVTVNDQRIFPAGTSVSAYAPAGWLQSQLPPAGAPKGSAVATATVDATSGAALTGLAAGASYYVAGQVGGVWRYVSVSTPRAGGEMLAFDHGTDANAARPSWEGVVFWAGTVEPVNAAVLDIVAIRAA
jgi:hypothetical protein